MRADVERALRQFVEQAPIAVAILDCELSYILCSERWREVFELVGLDIRGRPHFELLPDDGDHWRSIANRALGGEGPISGTEAIPRGRGELRWMKWSIRPWKRMDQSIGGIVITLEDVTELKEKKLAFQKSAAFWRSTIDTCPIAILTINEAGEILSFSAAAENVFGYSEAEAKGQNVSILMPPPHKSEHDQYLARYLKTGEKRIIGQPRTLVARRKGGEEFPAIVSINEFVDGQRVFVGFVQDISARKAAENQLAETQTQLQHAARLSALGEMATSIAHEINQPLTAAASLAGAASLILKRASRPTPEEALSLIDDAIGEIRRASEIIRQMREFVKKRKPVHSLNDVNKVIEDACSIALIGSATNGIKVDYRLDENVSSANIDRIQIQQVVTNLVRNAIEAMQDANRKNLTISAERRDGVIEIAVADTGHGVSDKMKAKIFEPFVSGKEDGVGIGLSITKAIVEAHQGEISVLDNNPNGAIFRIRLPADQETTAM